MDSFESLKRFMEKYKCSVDTALYYFELREEGCTPESALVWCGLAAPGK